jgi:tetratricopeptide (TPR) repeat protein
MSATVATTDGSGERHMALNEANTENSKPARLAEAQAASDAKDWHRAAELWEACRTDFPEDARCWHKSGEAFCHTGMLDQADQVLGEAVARFPDDEWSAYWHVVVARHKTDWHETLRRAEKMGRAFPASWRPMVEAADALVGLERSVEAEEIRREALKQFPNEFWTNYGVTRLEAERADPQGAVRIWSELVARFPTQPNAAAALQAAREAARHPLRQLASTHPGDEARRPEAPAAQPRGFPWRRRSTGR